MCNQKASQWNRAIHVQGRRNGLSIRRHRRLLLLHIRWRMRGVHQKLVWRIAATKDRAEKR